MNCLYFPKFQSRVWFVCSGFEAGNAVWKTQTNPLDYLIKDCVFQNQNTINNNADDNSNTNMNLIIPGRRRAFSSKNMSDSFVRLFEQDCFLHVLCRSIEKRENSVNRFSTKLVALASGLAISDFFGQNKLQDSNIFSVIQNSDSKSCHSNYECPLFEILSPMND